MTGMCTEKKPAVYLNKEPRKSRFPLSVDDGQSFVIIE